MLKELTEFVEKAYTPIDDARHNLMYDKRILDLVASHKCSIEPFNLTTYIITADSVTSRIMALCKVLKRLGLFCELVTNKSALISHDKDYLKAQVALLKKSIHYLDSIETSSVPKADSLEDFVEMANIKLKATTFADQVKELESLGYVLNNVSEERAQLQLKVKAHYLAVGEILSARARMEAYAQQVWPGNTFTHFVVKYGLKTPTYSMGISLSSMDEALKLSKATY